jgi:CBS domain-containing protein
MTVAREIMTADPVCVRASDTVHDAAVTMARLSVGALPIRGEDGTLKGMLTDRDIVVKVLAEGKDARAVHAGELAHGTPVIVAADADAEQVLRTMCDYQVRRVPVLDDGRLVGVVAQADVARALDNPQVGELVEALSVD